MATLTGSRGAQYGFTLLELLIVLVIIAVIAGTALLSVSGTSERRLREEAERLQQALQLVADEAILEGSERSVTLTQNSYGFLRYNAASHEWVPLPERKMRQYTLPEGLQFELNSDGMKAVLSAASQKQPQQTSLLFLSSGEMTPFRLAIISSSGKNSAVLATDGIAPITLHYEALHE